MTEYRVWDPLVRLFHWSLVAGFAANAFITEEDGKPHEWIGYGILALLAIRLVWGFAGPASARFAGFLPRRGGITAQLTDIATRRRRAHLGHTPLGALMIFNLLGAILLICVTGHMMTTNAFWGVEWVEEAHEALVFWTELSVLLHVAAVLYESRRTGVNLPRAMITGTKNVPEDVKLVP